MNYIDKKARAEYLQKRQRAKECYAYLMAEQEGLKAKIRTIRKEVPCDKCFNDRLKAFRNLYKEYAMYYEPLRDIVEEIVK